MYLVLLALVFLLAIIVVIKKNKYYNDNNYPPGPLCIPLIGSMWALGTNNLRMHTSLLALSKKWGPVFRLQVGSFPLIVITDPNILKEAFDNVDSPAFLRHITITFDKLFAQGGRSIIFPKNRNQWTELRKINSQIMRNFPGGPTKPEIITYEIQKLCVELDKHTGKPVRMNPFLTFLSRNVFLQMAFSQSWSYGKLEEHEKEYINLMAIFTSNLSSVFDFFPSLQFMRSISTNRVVQCGKQMDKYVKNIIDARKKHPLPSEETAKDFLDWVLLEQKRNPNYSDQTMLQTIRDLLLSSTFTTADTLDWIILFLCEYPDMQEKCYKEISDNLGGRQPVVDDQVCLPYLDSFLKETARLRPAVPLGVPRKIDSNCTIGGYRIDKGSIVMTNLYGIGNSEKFFKNATEFDPERWIRNPEMSNCQFGFGPNSCLGMPLARQQTFLTAASLIQRYQFRYDLSSSAPDIAGEFNMAFNPSKWNTIITRR